MSTTSVPAIQCDKMAVNGISFRNRAVIKLLLMENISAADIYGRRRVYGDACMGASRGRRWAKLFKDARKQ